MCRTVDVVWLVAIVSLLQVCYWVHGGDDACSRRLVFVV